MGGPGLDLIKVIGKAAIGEIPAGKFVLALISENVSRHQRQGVESMINTLFLRLRQHHERLAETVDEDEVAEIAHTCVLAASRTHRQERIDAIANILLSAVLRDGEEDKLEFDELDFFARCVESISLEAIRLLKAVHESEMVASVGFLSDHLGKDEDVVLALCGELERFGLARSDRDETIREQLKQIQNNMDRVDPQLPPYHWNPSSTRIMLTSIGWRFVTFVLTAHEQSHDDGGEEIPESI